MDSGLPSSDIQDIDHFPSENEVFLLDRLTGKQTYK